MTYFSEEELACTHCGEYKFDADFLAILNSIRESCGFPLVVTSGYRCPNHPINVMKEAEGKPFGAHAYGLAVDIHVTHKRAYRLVQTALEHGIQRIGVNQKGHGRFIHLDVDKSLPHPTIWSY